ncbi:MAG: MFS transporter [Candidatus Thorarchaeota archaeon]
MESAELVEDKPLRPFAILWGGQAASLFGTRIVRFALVWWITDITGSATVLAIATIMAILPQVFIAPFAGSYVDRWNRRKTMIAADALIATTVLGLSFLFASGLIEIWHIFVMMFLGASFGAFHFPAMQASTTMMVPRKHLGRIGGMNQALNGASNIVAPPVGAVLYVLLPMQSILLVDVTTAAFAILCLALIAIPQPKRKDDPKKTSVLGDMKEGFVYLKNWRPGMILVIVAMMLNFLAAPAFSLSPVLVSNYFLGGEVELALLQSFGAVAMVVGAVLLTIWGGGKRKSITILTALVLEGVGTLLIGLVPANSFFMAILFYAFVSFLNPIVNGILIAIMQATIPPEKQGRVFALIVSGATAMMPVGLAIAGPLADLYGVPFWFLISGVGTIIVSIAASFSSSLRNIEESVVSTDETEIQVQEEVEETVFSTDSDSSSDSDYTN